MDSIGRIIHPNARRDENNLSEVGEEDSFENELVDIIDREGIIEEIILCFK